MSLRERAARDVGRGFGLFAVAFAVLALVVAMLSQVGLPGSMASVLVAAGTLVSYVVIGFATRTMNLEDFQVALRGVPPALNGMATPAAPGGFAVPSPSPGRARGPGTFRVRSTCPTRPWWTMIPASCARRRRCGHCSPEPGSTSIGRW